MEKITIEEIQKLIGEKYKVISYKGSKTPIILLSLMCFSLFDIIFSVKSFDTKHFHLLNHDVSIA